MNCFPGEDYVRHYAAIIRNYYWLVKGEHVRVEAELPGSASTRAALLATNLSFVPKSDIFIVGVVDKLELAGVCSGEWEGADGDFHWKSGVIDDCRVTLLGCTFSIWGDISRHLAHILGERGARLVLYTGKVGGLRPDHAPNIHLATGCESLVGTATVKWNNPVVIDASSQFVKVGSHATSYSILAEDKEWLRSHRAGYHFVDPEIGQMAIGCQDAGIGFGYLHVISNNLTAAHAENLSNERSSTVQSKRSQAVAHINAILTRSVMSFVCNRYQTK